MKANARIAGAFEQIAALLELTGGDRFRVNAHRRAARAIDSHPEDVTTLDHDALVAIEGVGEKSAAKVREFQETGRLKELDELLERVPVGLLEVLELPGLGPKTVRVLWTKGGVESVADLERVIEDGTIHDLPRMGEKTVANIREAIEFASHAGERTPLGVAMPIAERLVEALSEVPGVRRAGYAGSLRRGRDTIGDVDILVVADDPASVRDVFTSLAQVSKVLASGEKKSSVRIEDEEGRVIQADLRIVPGASWGAALLYFTGSKEHNVRLRERAQRRGLTLNEYGLYPEDRGGTPPQDRGVEPVASETEEAVYEALGLAWVPPELREDRGEVSEGFEPPSLIEVGDVKAELHAHTTASDGRMSIVELAERARERGFHTIAVTDHSRSSAIAGGLDEDELRAHIEAVREADAEVEGITILAGSEVDILADGSLDYGDDLLEELDIVVASPHASLRQDEKTATERLLRAVEHPMVHVLGHPTGRLIGAREGFHPDMRAVAVSAAAHGVALEINCNWKRLDLRDAHVRTALECGALIAVDCDVHRPDHFDNLRYGVMTARRGGLTPGRCVNTWPAKKLYAWLREKRGSR